MKKALSRMETMNVGGGYYVPIIENANPVLVKLNELLRNGQMRKR